MRRTAHLLIVALAMCGGACRGADSSSGPPAPPGSGQPGTGAPALATPLAPPSSVPAGTTGFKVYWMRACPAPEKATEVTTCRVALGEPRTTDRPDLPAAALDALLAGPNDAEKVAGLTTNIRKSATLYDFHVEGTTAVVDLLRYFETAQTRPQVAQVVYTLTQFPEITKVQFLIDHQPNGATGVPPLDRGDVDDLTPTVFVDAPALHASVAHLVHVYGTAVASDGVVRVSVLNPAGEEVASTTSGVAAPNGTRGAFGVTIVVPPTLAGDATLAASASATVNQVPVSVT